MEHLPRQNPARAGAGFSFLREERAGRGRERGGPLPARTVHREMKFSPSPAERGQGAGGWGPSPVTDTPPPASNFPFPARPIRRPYRVIPRTSASPSGSHSGRRGSLAISCTR